MSIEQKILQRLRQLSTAKQMDVLEFVDSLVRTQPAPGASQNLGGLWADLGVSISEEDIAEARREMWGKFPRQDT